MIDEVAVRTKARHFMVGLDLSAIAQDLSVYTQKVGAKLKTEAMSKGESGYTLTRRNGTSSIVVNETERLERQRFTICHEVAHLVLELESDHKATPPWSYAKRNDNEIACDIFASELLMPFDAFKRDVDQAEPSFELVEELRARYVVSFSACASRVAAVTDYPCAFVLMSSGMVRYASRSKALRDLNAWIEMRSPIPAGSVAHRLIREDQWAIETSDVSQDVWFRDWPKGYDLREMARHYPDYDETFSLVWFEGEDGPDEPVANWGGTPARPDDDGLRELDGILRFRR